MDLLESLSQEDKNLLWDYLNAYSDGSALDNIDYFLRYWNIAKKPFFTAFGEKLIVSKDILFEIPRDELIESMESAIWYGPKVIRDFCQTYRRKVKELPLNIQYDLESFVITWSLLVDNIYKGKSFSIPGEATKDGRPLQINSGCKVVKMLGKIVDALDCAEGYEEFRQAHSQVLNQKRIGGKLCLSIHPMDYITMSDNACGWTSCMSWMEEFGDYRLGTIEMMNSPSVVIAYVEAKEPMAVPGGSWNNKRWRQLYIANDTVILGNRQYPYYHDVLQGEAIKWLRDLLSPLPGWGPYAPQTCNIRNKAWNTIGDRSVHFNFYCTYMYNDVYDLRLAYLADKKFEDNSSFSLNFSGLAICTGCGSVIEPEEVESHQVQCRVCGGQWRCDCCGEWHSDYDISYTVDDRYTYCDWCYHNELDTCEICGDPSRDVSHVYLQLNTTDEELISLFNYSYYVSVCDYCGPQEYEPLFGPMYTVRDMWNYPRKAFFLDNITDKGLERGNLSQSQIDFLKALRESKSDEDRLDLLRKGLY